MTINRKREGERIVTLAQHHADAGVFQFDAVRDVTIGLRPAWNPDDDPRHSRALDAINQETVLEEHAATLRDQNERISAVGEPVSLLLVKASLFAVIEALGCTALMTSLGYHYPENVFFGVAAAAGIFALVGLSHRKHDPWKYAGLLILAVVMLAISAVRVDDVQRSDELPAMLRWGLGIVTLLATVGPAFLAEPVLRKLVALFPDVSRRWHTRREMRRLQRRVTAAHATRDAVADAQRAWDADNVWLAGLYTLTYNARRAELGRPPELRALSGGTS